MKKKVNFRYYLLITLLIILGLILFLTTINLLLKITGHGVLNLDIVNSTQKITNTTGLVANFSNLDYFGWSIANIGDLNGDGVIDLAVGVTGDDDGTSGAGAVYILFMNTNGTVNSSQKISKIEGNFNEATFSKLGYSIANIGDLNGDSITDLAVGTWNNKFYILFMNTNGTVNSSQEISTTKGNFDGDVVVGDTFSSAIVSIGDLDGDNITDLVVGAASDDDGANGAGAVYILFMNTNGTVKSNQKISDTYGNFNGVLENGDYFGTSATSIGDLDGDGITDIAVGALWGKGGGDEIGKVFILFLNTDGTVKSYQELANDTGTLGGLSLEEYDYFGTSLAYLGDLDYDGVGDIAVGVRQALGTSDGAMYILFMNSNGTVKSSQKIGEGVGNFGSGIIDTGDEFGKSVANIGDLNEDGIVDLAIGSIKDGGAAQSAGAIYLVFLNISDQVNPVIQFVNPTQDSGSARDLIEINVTVFEPNLDTITINLYDSNNNLLQTNTSSTSPFYISYSNLNGGLHYYNITANDTLGNIGNTETRTITISPVVAAAVETTTTSTNTGGSAPAPVEGAPEVNKVQVIAKVKPESPVTISAFKETGVTEVTIEVNKETLNVKVEVAKYESKPLPVSVEVSGKTYRYLEITVENLNSNLEKATIKFEVDKTWVGNNNLEKNDVAVSKFDELNEKWNELDTKFDSEDDNFYYYTIVLDSFSFFAIGEKIGVIKDIPSDSKSSSFLKSIRENVPLWIWWMLVIILSVSIIVVANLILELRKEK